MKRFCCVVLLAVMLLGVFASVPAMADYVGEDFKATVISSGAKVYEKSSAKSHVLGTLKKGATVTVTGAKGKWATVRSGYSTGCMRIMDLCSSLPGKIVTVKSPANVYYIRKSGKNKTGWAQVAAGKVLYVYGKDESGRWLAGNRSKTALCYIPMSKVKDKNP